MERRFHECAAKTFVQRLAWWDFQPISDEQHFNQSAMSKHFKRSFETTFEIVPKRNNFLIIFFIIFKMKLLLNPS